MATSMPPVISVVSPAYNEVDSLPLMYDRMCSALDELGLTWEWVIVDDHSRDGTPAVLEQLSTKDARVRAMRLSRNFGSHAAVLAGVRHSQGDCVVVMASDLQDPPEVIARLIERWQAGAKTVWGVRERRDGESILTVWPSRLYHRLLRGLTPLNDTPVEGADMWLMDRQVVEALNNDPERHSSVTALVRWMGFAQDAIYYVKDARRHGRSKWTLARKINHAINTFVASTVLPIRLMTYVGLTTGLLGILYSLVVIWNAIGRHPIPGWSSLMVVVLVVSGVQMLMLGVLGEYLWRTYEESRQRPRYIVERWLNLAPMETIRPHTGSLQRQGEP
jgi:polyisoprenyl-phosphate glycosyltransferase